MKDRCIAAVSEAIGRPITKAEAVKIEDRIKRNMRVAASFAPEEFLKLPAEERLMNAAAMAGKEIVEEANLKKRRIELTIQAHDRVQTFLDEAKQAGLDGLDALRRTLVFKSDGKSNTLSAESRGSAVRANALRQLVDTFEAVDPRLWGLFESEEGVRTLTRAIFGEKTGNAIVDKGAEAWRNVASQLRDQFNAAGGKIGELKGWAIPQHHSQTKVAKAGRETWVGDVFGKLDRSKYLNDDGSRMNDEGVMAMLREAWTTIATGGINQMTPGGVEGGSMLANRRAWHRELHFKDADSYLDYQANYGEKSLWGVITGHVENLSKEIAMLETYGPNPDRTFQLFLEKELQALALSDPTGTEKHKQEGRRLTGLYDFVTGATAPVVNQHLAQGFDTLRNWLVSSRLGSAVITALTDEATLHLTAKVNNLPEMQLIQNELAALNVANRTEENLAHRAGLGIDTMLSHLNRWGQDNLGPTWSSKMANTVMRASGMEALDGARRRAFGVTYLSALGEIVGKYGKLADIDPVDHRILASKGITDTDFSIWKQAELEQWGAGNGVLTPESIMRIPDEKLGPLIDAERARIEELKMNRLSDIEQAKAAMGEDQFDRSTADMGKVYDDMMADIPGRLRRDAVLRLLGVTLEETDMAVIRPGAEDRFLTAGQFQRGTWSGELARSFFQFKAFPLAMIARHWMRGVNMETTGGKAAYIASLVVGTTILGAVSQTINDLLTGKDPRNYNPVEGEHGIKNWVGAFLKGGSLGIYGDFLFSGATQHSQNGPLASLMGPVAGLVEESFNLTQGNLIQLARGEDTHAGAELVKFVKGNLPGANLWYAKAALDHLIFHQMQEYFSPGYLATMERRARKDFGQSFYWTPGTGIDGIRAPEMAKAIGE